MKKAHAFIKTVHQGKIDPTEEYYRDTRSSAMRGQIERALVELITNSDDSYRDLEDAGQRVTGAIRVEITRRNRKPTLVVVKDRAAGMSADEMDEKLTRPGARTSAFHGGKSRRGLHGRGAKDVADFGRAVFESIKDGWYSRCTIGRMGDYQIEAGLATPSQHRRLGVKTSGTMVTIEVESGYRVPTHSTLAERFDRHYALHDIFGDDNRKCELVDVDPRTGEPRDVKTLRFQDPEGEVVVAGHEIRIDGFPDLKDSHGDIVAPVATVDIKIHAEQFSEEKHGPGRPYRLSGLLVKSGVAIHDKTLFSFENDPHAQRLFGAVTCPYIDELVRHHDEVARAATPPEWNNIRVLDPNRDGFAREHPFISRLYSECDSILRGVVEDLKKREGQKERKIQNARVESWLRAAMKKASQLFEDKLREMDEIPPSTGRVGATRSWPVGITIVPRGEHRIVVGERKTFSVFVRFESPVPAGATVSVETDNPQDIRITSSTLALKPERSDPCLARCTMNVEGTSVGAEGFVSASSNGYKDVVLVEVVEDLPPDEVPPGLSFERDHYRLGYNKTKSLVLRYLGQLPQGSLPLIVSSNNSGVVVKKSSCLLSPTAIDGLYRCAVPVVGRRLGSHACIRALLGDVADAVTNVTVTESGPESNSALKKPKLVDADFGSVRARWSSSDPNLLEVACRHPAIALYLGSPDDDFPGQEREGFRAMLAEVIAEALAWRLLEKRYREPGLREDMTPTDYYTEYSAVMRDFLAVMHQGIVADLRD